MLGNFNIYDKKLDLLPNDQKLLINTINAYSYTMTLKDSEFKKALQNCDVLIPDGVSVVKALKWINGKNLVKIAGADLFKYEMNRLNKTGGKCMFLGSSEMVLQKIRNNAALEYDRVIVKTYSPPFKPNFDRSDTHEMIDQVNDFCPDVLFVGMTAPKQEKWAYDNINSLHVGHVCCIGAVFDFYAGTSERAPSWIINLGLEWLHRLIKEPKRMWRRYLIGNTLFMWYILKEKLNFQ